MEVTPATAAAPPPHGTECRPLTQPPLVLRSIEMRSQLRDLRELCTATVRQPVPARMLMRELGASLGAQASQLSDKAAALEEELHHTSARLLAPDEDGGGACPRPPRARPPRSESCQQRRAAPAPPRGRLAPAAAARRKVALPSLTPEHCRPSPLAGSAPTLAEPEDIAALSGAYVTPEPLRSDGERRLLEALGGQLRVRSSPARQPLPLQARHERPSATTPPRHLPRPWLPNAYLPWRADRPMLQPPSRLTRRRHAIAGGRRKARP